MLRDRHHLLWEKRAYKTSIEKTVRKLGTFILEVPIVNHRLLHMSLRPPEKPSNGTLHDMKILAKNGLDEVMTYLDDPIIEHFHDQLEIINLKPEVAYEMLQEGELWTR